MHLPNYKDGSIVNLMASLERALGGRPRYSPLRLLPPKELKSKNIVLLVIDGLGHEWLRRHGKGSTLLKHIRGKMTSVFPSTTATCVTTFSTGLAPQQHAITGWFIYLKELGTVSTILHYVTREGKVPIKADTKRFFDQETFSERITATHHYVVPEDFLTSEVAAALAGKAKMLPHTDIQSYFKRIAEVIKLRKKRKCVYAYWPEFDSLCHHNGTTSTQAAEHFRELDEGFASLLDSIKGTDTTLVLTADHGHIDTPQSRLILVEKHPKFEETLALPLCGEPRLAYCYVYPKKAKQFEHYVKTHFKDYCQLHKSKELIKRGYFGLFKPNPKLAERVGDYTLIMKEDCTIKDFVPGEPRKVHEANHGGVSKEEMHVPLIVAQP